MLESRGGLLSNHVILKMADEFLPDRDPKACLVRSSVRPGHAHIQFGPENP
jgi:hypothetical protein